jgi:anti-anti-sigma factor
MESEMSVVGVAGTGPAALPAASLASRNARFGIFWPTPECAVVSADGAIDAANAGEFADYALRVALQSQHLVLDLSGVEFCGIQSFSMLQMLNLRCAKAGVRWALVPSAAVKRVLRICDPEGGLPVATTVDAALAATKGRRLRRLQLVVS